GQSAQIQSGNNLSIRAKNATLAGTQAAQSALTIDASETLNHSGKSSAASISLNAPELNNSGVLFASSLKTQSQTLTNSGLLQGDQLLAVNTRNLDNQLSGTLYSAENLTLDIPDITNSGLITSDKALMLTATTLTSPGKITASALNVQADTLAGVGLLQGDRALVLSGETLSQGAAGRWLTAGDLSLNAKNLTTAGTTQGQNLSIHATDWFNTGSVLATGQLDVTLARTLLNNGDLLSQGNLTFNIPGLTNHGKLLAAGDISLTGNLFRNDGTLQGNTLSLMQESIDNQGAVIGLNGLTLNSTGALNNHGDLLSQKALTITTGDITNSGRLQGQNITLDGASLNNSGAIQSALDLALTLSGDVIATTGSKITALGDARLNGKTLSNQGQIAASTLAIQGDSLNNSGDISGVNGLALTLAGDLQQQGKMLTGGELTVTANDITNSGQVQGAETQINASTLTNSGRIQGNSGLTLTLLAALTNQADGVILSQNALNLTAPVLNNDGTLQGAGNTVLNAVTQARNSGKILSGGDLTLITPDYSGDGWLQATDLVLNVAQLVNSGTVMSTRQTTLTGNRLSNTGLFQADMLNIDYQTLTNHGTLLGNQRLQLMADTVDNSNGNLFSSGDLLADLSSLSGAGQMVALGNLTLKLVNSFTSQGIIAANQQLTLESLGDITNSTTLQGNGITIDAAGTLTNNGQLTAGFGTTSLRGNQIVMNESGSLQAGGDVSLTSRGNITLNGFTGTAGSLTLNAAGVLLNTALLYAGNNLSLFANSIQNLHGDILAGNNLLMQKDASGAANADIINTSGNIETVNGDITINTGHLLNTRDELTTSSITTHNPSQISGLGNATISPPLSQLPVGSYYTLTIPEWERCTGVANTHCVMVPAQTTWYMKPEFATQYFAASKTETVVSASGGVAGIRSGGNLMIHADRLDNNASVILANANIDLTGSTLSNQSWQAGTDTESWIYQNEDSSSDNKIEFILKGKKNDSIPGEIFRSVIQAGGNINANFASDISNTNTTANAGHISNTLAAPNLNTPSAQNVDGGASQQALADAATLDIAGPDWKDTSTRQTIGGGTGLAPGGMDGNYPLPSGKNGYFVTSTDPDSPYLITVNPKLDGLGQLDPSLFGDLYKLLGMNPGAAPRETGSQYADANSFLGSSYMLDRLNLHPDRDYRFLGDAAFDTRYVSNYVLNQTGTRYINGLGSDLDQMRYLMDRAAEAQTSLGLKFGMALTAAQIAALDHSMLWWETATINGQTVMVPKVYLSPKDVTINNGSVIAGNN
ncbi:MAG TPA: Contact-dependent inhibitor A, partial [Buttiauxella sp.]